MKFNKTPIAGCYFIAPDIHTDGRGAFYEASNQKLASELGQVFPQDNVSHSRKGVLRGLHLQKRHPQGKLVRVLNGMIWDVCADLRADSPTFGEWFGTFLTTTGDALYIPPGCAHGFYALEESAVYYKCTTLYDKESDGGIVFDDPELGVSWPHLTLGLVPLVSAKDLALPSLRDYVSSLG